MTNKENEISPSSIQLKKETGIPNVLEQSDTFIRELLERLQLSEKDLAFFQETPFAYNQPFEAIRQEYPQQAVVVMALFQPGPGNVVLGNLHPETSIITGLRTGERWATGTWAVPMGKIDSKLDVSANDTLGAVINKAAQRELGEEVQRIETEDIVFIAGSFLDTKTKNLIHVVIEDIDYTGTGPKELKITLPNDREHSAIRWTKLKHIPDMITSDVNSKMVFRTALHIIQKQNQRFRMELL